MEKKSTRQVPELWGGIECSYNRVKSKYFDQLIYSNHYQKTVQHLEMIASLGITTMRYPVIWERLCPEQNAAINWSTVDTPLNALHQLNIQPIAGLVHHGSGPRYADLLSPSFPTRLAEFAGKVAERFPWVEYYTPVNEPLTTARFACLYGLWYPHKRNDKVFVQALLMELKAVVLSMRAVREVNPVAKLVQTEDLAKIYSTPFMKYQADFENHRRWLTFDILCGKLVPGHPLWKYFKRYANSESDLYFFAENPCPPNVIGLDYYPTSERYLDENLERYPVERHGHNHRHHYADVEAVRIKLNESSGPRILLKEVWDRYHLPMAVTEVHIHCDYDNQVRWFNNVYRACIDLIAEGVDLRAITSWAMLGSFGWNRLLTQPGGLYESGAFDVSSGSTTATPLAEFIRNLSVNPNFDHEACHQPGWWEDDSRFIFGIEEVEESLDREVPAPVKCDCIER